MPSFDYFDDIAWKANIYHPSQNLALLQFRLALAGYRAPELKHACDLAYGQGVSLLANATVSPDVRWHGTDFNSQHHALAETANAAIGTGASLSGDDFASYSRQDLPAFQFVSAMGTWSWIREERRQEIVDFLLAHLDQGGIFNLNYMCSPGQAIFAPFRQFALDVYLHKNKAGDASHQGAIEALAFVKTVMMQNPWFLRAYPEIGDYLDRAPEEDPDAFLHEFLNAEWSPMSYREVAEFLEPVELSFACDGRFGEHLVSLHLDERQRSFLGQMGDPAVAETAQDFIRLRSERNDYWIRGAKKISPGDRLEILKETGVCLLRSAEEEDYLVEGTLGPVRYERENAGKALAALNLKGPMRIGDLHGELGGNCDFESLLNLIAAYLDKGTMSVCLTDTPSSRACTLAENFNKYHLDGHSGENITVLVSPVAQTGMQLSTDHFAYMQAIREGHANIPALVESAQARRKLFPTRARKQLASGLNDDAEIFLKQQVPILKHLMLV